MFNCLHHIVANFCHLCYSLGFANANTETSGQRSYFGKEVSLLDNMLGYDVVKLTLPRLF